MYWLLLPLVLFADVKSQIISFYKSRYPDINITKITSSPPLPSHYKTLKILLNPRSNSGVVKVDKKYYFIKINATLPAYISTKTLMPNTLIYPYVKKSTIPFKHIYTKPLLNISKQLVAKKIIAKGAVITSQNTKTPPAVLKNQKVKVIIKSKAIEIISSAKALKDGDIGVIIPVNMNNKIINAKVIAKGEVSIE
ncbi:MAG: flagellar basal body P-ring formation protein FlgA [Epsilonproteobacteria bacterium]|nr:flagellar basal body P-ring formation protein FlgA [Campylobacterota bacterium]